MRASVRVSVALLVHAIVRADRAVVSALGGIGFGALLLCSYGLVLLAIVPAAVAWQHRRLAALLPAAITSATMLATVYGAGFNYLAGIAATHGEYVRGVARNRPYGYALVANLATFALIIGPAAVVGVTRLAKRHGVERSPVTGRSGVQPLRGLVGGALLAVAIADVSGMSKLEVERIWLPFAVWVLPAAAAVTLGRRATMTRTWLAAQMALAIGLQITVRTGW